MSGHQYVKNPDNLFEDDDDIDDSVFLKNASKNPFVGNAADSVNSNQQNQKQMYEEKKKEIENRTLESSQRTLGLLYETEEVGKATAAELAKQREQLEKSSRQLEEINQTLRFSQKHLNGLKSVFGGLKNYLSGNRDAISPRTHSSTSSEGGPSQRRPSSTSPQENFNQPQYQQQPQQPRNTMNGHNGAGQPGHSLNLNGNQSTNPFDQKLQNNLAQMCGGLDRLKNLAIDMRGEIETQNDMLDDMNYKMEDIDLKITKQKKDMDKIMGK